MDCSQASAVPRLCLVALAIGMMLSTGCTMCPDPYDYSGPVPNGSPPQNDFRARSNGILPLGAAPTPWPLIVRHGSAGGGTPTLANGGPAVELPAGDVQPVSVLVTAGVDEPVDADDPAGVEAGSEPQRGDPWAVVPAFTTVAEEAPALAETPGWRPRTSR